MTTLEELRLATPDHVQRPPPVGRRAPATEAAYARHLGFVRSNYESTRDYILVAKLGFGARAGATGRVAARVARDEARWAARRNAFPYDLEAGLVHFVLWTNESNASPARVEARVLEAFAHVPPGDLHWFVNERGLRTFADVAHAHVFVRGEGSPKSTLMIGRALSSPF